MAAGDASMRYSLDRPSGACSIDERAIKCEEAAEVL